MLKCNEVTCDVVDLLLRLGEVRARFFRYSD